MPKSTPPRHKGHAEVLPPLSKFDRISELLQIQLQTFPQKELSPEEIERWHQDLSAYPVEAIEWAFENWRKSGTFFPVPADILQQCKAWGPTTGNWVCDAECKSRHGRGYGESDLLWLYHRFQTLRAAVSRKLTKDEVRGLLDELDKKRGWSPEWRTVA